jgi:hypothetical protein
MADIKRWGDRLSLLLGFETTEIIEYLYGLDQSMLTKRQIDMLDVALIYGN